jgi:acetyl-CoA/propionyl-CoA carboxylase biotin carboxyl carrier protein
VTRLIADDGRREVERSVPAAVATDQTATTTAAAIPAIARAGDTLYVDVDGRSVAFRVAPPPDVDRAARAAAAHARGGGSAEIVAPMPGAVVAVHVSQGQHVDAGDPVVTVEAMKMEHAVAATAAGRIAELRVRGGDQVTRGQTLATLDA